MTSRSRQMQVDLDGAAVGMLEDMATAVAARAAAVARTPLNYKQKDAPAGGKVVRRTVRAAAKAAAARRSPDKGTARAGPTATTTADVAAVFAGLGLADPLLAAAPDEIGKRIFGNFS